MSLASWYSIIAALINNVMKTIAIANAPIADRIGPSIVGLVNPKQSASTHKTLNSFEVSS